MKKNKLVAACMASTMLLWACGNDDKKKGDNLSTGEVTVQDSAATGTPNTGASAALDTMAQNFAVMAASGDMLEIQSSNMAMQNASSDRVKSFATMMIRDHGQTSTEMKTLVAGKGVTLPTDLLPPHKTLLSNLQGKTGKDFDKAYMDLQVQSHQQSVSLFERASNNLSNTELKNFASQHLPHLRMHLDSAQAINRGKM